MIIYKTIHINRLWVWAICVILTAVILMRASLAVAPAVRSELENQEKVVYFTFDDGPSKNTAKILDVLKKSDVKATFFVTGNEEPYAKATMRRIVAEGHTIAPHTYSHRYHNIYQSVEGYQKDFDKICTYITDVTGMKTNVYRFPGGSTNRSASKAVREGAIEHISKKGYVYFDWNVVSGDDTAVVYPPETLAKNVLTASKGKNTVVVLFHDAPICKTTPKAVEILIGEFRKQGYSFARITSETDPIQFAAKKFAV